MFKITEVMWSDNTETLWAPHHQNCFGCRKHIHQQRNVPLVCGSTTQPKQKLQRFDAILHAWILDSECASKAPKRLYGSFHTCFSNSKISSAADNGSQKSEIMKSQDHRCEGTVNLLKFAIRCIPRRANSVGAYRPAEGNVTPKLFEGQWVPHCFSISKFCDVCIAFVIKEIGVFRWLKIPGEKWIFRFGKVKTRAHLKRGVRDETFFRVILTWHFVGVRKHPFIYGTHD